MTVTVLPRRDEYAALNRRRDPLTEMRRLLGQMSEHLADAAVHLDEVQMGDAKIPTDTVAERLYQDGVCPSKVYDDCQLALVMLQHAGAWRPSQLPMRDEDFAAIRARLTQLSHF